MNKQIEGRTCIDCIHYPVCCLWSTTDLIENEQHKFCFGNLKTVAEFAYNAGYRKAEDIYEDVYEGRIEIIKKGSNDKLKKASDVAREIFSEIDTEICNALKKADNEIMGFNYCDIIDRVLDELKKKYGVEKDG